ncbi:MAG: adenylate/guanylate cyclase domain-containing protein [Candidatus Binatia bacterium]
MLSVLFVDIRGFTSLAEKTSPTDVAAQLNRFYEAASKAIFRQDGTLDKLVGDQVMAFFGPPLNHDDHARRAVTTALEISRAIGEFATDDALAVGVGITTGEAFVGNVGGSDVTDYTVLGDTVNVAARLESKALSGEILISQATYDQVADAFPHATRRELALKGKSDRVIAWQIAEISSTTELQP